ncbi:hypothetical protein HP398_10835 [Brevibacillus sp. HB1.4B]|uniref:hypothetical protein n=1 Tax=Brevibacillus sp. HB1.4B TaxID=2738845 RepID=UPI00037771D2|nr:hypothetical protein [Brevibacillus sp. HB1.4B]ATF11069.1 hypothetical protein A616_03315 [Brevibacillus brevis X23]NRS16925.1 hypothetical protein [Brevibacillus sp. HB1.4B]
METLPPWVWNVYYIFILITIISSIVYLIRKRRTLFSMITIFFSIFGPIVFFLQSLMRGSGTEIDNLLYHLTQGEIWALFVILAFMEIVAWYLILAKDLLGKREQKNNLRT